jgi:hypothetical protein
MDDRLDYNLCIMNIECIYFTIFHLNLANIMIETTQFDLGTLVKLRFFFQNFFELLT